VGILTYRRPDSLIRTLESLRGLGRSSGPAGSGADETDGTPASADIGSSRTVGAGRTIEEVVVIDNDREPSAREAVDHLVASGYPHRIRYVHEPRPGLAAARNRALDEAGARVLVFIDDDEVATPGWPEGLLDTMERTGAGLVGGPVRTVFTRAPAPWVTAGGFFDRAEPADRSAQSWLRSGNLAIDLDAVRPTGVRFDPAFGFSGGEDVAFSRGVCRAGLDLRWSATAVVEEAVGPERASLRWLVRRELTSTTNWVRVERALDPSRRRAALVTARGLLRLAQGVATAGVGLVTLDSVHRNRGLVTVARGVGAFRGLTARVPETYRVGNDARR
jgi:GT2 family glycosyltransferase